MTHAWAKFLRRLVAALAALALLVLGAAQLGFFQGTPPTDLGVRDGRLKSPSPTPNSVSSQAALYPEHPQRAYAAIAPLVLPGTPEQALGRLEAVLKAQPRLKITEKAGTYLRVEAFTPWLRFADDLEFWAQAGATPGQALVQVRSASRLGGKDFGVNRARIEALRAVLAAQETPGAADNKEPPLTGY